MIAVIVDSELANAELRSRIRLLHVLHRANGSTKRSRFRILPQTGQDALIKRRGYGNRTPVPSDVGDLYGFEFDVTTEKVFLESDNVRDHRAGTNDHPFQKHTQVRLRVHHIVIRRNMCSATSQRLKSDFMASTSCSHLIQVFRLR